MLETDQLGWLMSKGTIFRGFKEHPIKFRPTYKVLCIQIDNEQFEN